MVRQLKPTQDPMKRQLVLHVGRLVKPLIVIDAKGNPGCPTVASGSGNLRRKKRRLTDDITTNAGRDGKSGTSARKANPDLRIVPVNRKGNGSYAQNAKVECVIRVFPDVSQ